MLTIQIKNWQNKVTATINNIYSLQVDEEVNKGCKVKLRFPVADWLQKKPIQKADRITIAYSFNVKTVVRIFEGYITDVTLKSTEVTIDFIGSHRNEIFFHCHSCNGFKVNTIVFLCCYSDY